MIIKQVLNALIKEGKINTAHTLITNKMSNWDIKFNRTLVVGQDIEYQQLPILSKNKNPYDNHWIRVGLIDYHHEGTPFKLANYFRLITPKNLGQTFIYHITENELEKFRIGDSTKHTLGNLILKIQSECHPFQQCLIPNKIINENNTYSIIMQRCRFSKESVETILDQQRYLLNTMDNQIISCPSNKPLEIEEFSSIIGKVYCVDQLL